MKTVTRWRTLPSYSVIFSLLDIEFGLTKHGVPVSNSYGKRVGEVDVELYPININCVKSGFGFERKSSNISYLLENETRWIKCFWPQNPKYWRTILNSLLDWDKETTKNTFGLFYSLPECGNWRDPVREQLKVNYSLKTATGTGRASVEVPW